ncbi:MAG TPA: hypothetical protein DDW87_09520 [Firmicutes bacterium]|nr:hypothetical protein [Bacillota bacterium]
MPLGEAVTYLKFAVRRRFGSGVKVRFVDSASSEALTSEWKDERPFPLVIIDGVVFSKGTFAAGKIVQELRRRSNKG